MTVRVQLVLLILSGAIVLLPLGVLHPVVVHLTREGSIEYHRGLFSPGFVGLLAIAGAGILPLFGFLAAIRTAQQARRSTARLLMDGEPRSLAGVTYTGVPGEGFVLLTAGFWRPAIVVSGGAEAALNSEELHAALLHERAHQQRRDVLWRALLVAVTGAFGLFPVVRSLVRMGILHSECMADDEALRLGAGRKALFEAVVVASGNAPRAIGANLAGGAVEFRLLRIARHDSTLPPGPSRGLGALLMAAVALPIAGHLLVVVGLVCAS